MKLAPFVNKLSTTALLCCLSMNANALDHEPVVGGILGAGSGVGIAAATSGNLVVGAGIGAVLGAFIGEALAKDAKDPNKVLDGSGMRIIDDKFGTSLILSTDMAFKPNSTEVLEPKYYIVLNQVAKLLNRYPDTGVTITGHTDNIYNRTMSMEKSHEYAKTVSDYLLSQGVQGERIIAVMAGGDHMPNYSNRTFDGRKMNRRVEITIHKRLP